MKEMQRYQKENADQKETVIKRESWQRLWDRESPAFFFPCCCWCLLRRKRNNHLLTSSQSYRSWDFLKQLVLKLKPT